MDAEFKVFNSFFNLKSNRLYFSQIKDHSGLSNSSLQNAIKKLLNRNILSKEKTKANIFININDKKAFAIEYSKIALEKFNTLNRNIRIPLKEAIDKMPKQIHSIILFGSSSRNKEEKNSDIDLLIILHSFNDKNLQKKYEENLIPIINNLCREVETRSNNPISTAFTTVNELKNNKDHLIIQAVSTGFPILNQQNYYETIL
jgi:predicted nucleotidyltransferase